MLKKIISILALLVIGALIYAYFAPKDYKIVSKITINLPADSVFNYVKIIKNQRSFSKWAMQDPNSKMEYIGTDGTVGFKNTWDSEVEDVGAGEQVITKVDDIVGGIKTLEIELKFIKPFEGKGKSIIEVIPKGNACEVVSTLNSSAAWPLNLINSFIESSLQTDMDINSSNLKRILED